MFLFSTLSLINLQSLVRCSSALHAVIRLHPALLLWLYSTLNSLHVGYTFTLMQVPSKKYLHTCSCNQVVPSVLLGV